eukprot:7210772-Prorocentrum_lima.AAC.1
MPQMPVVGVEIQLIEEVTDESQSAHPMILSNAPVELLDSSIHLFIHSLVHSVQSQRTRHAHAVQRVAVALPG